MSAGEERHTVAADAEVLEHVIYELGLYSQK